MRATASTLRQKATRPCSCSLVGNSWISSFRSHIELKPFNFLLTCHVRAFGHPDGADPELFHLIAPWESDPKRWTQIDWIDQYSGRTYRITTLGHHGTDRAARVKTYGEVLEEYEWHPGRSVPMVAGSCRESGREATTAPPHSYRAPQVHRQGIESP